MTTLANNIWKLRRRTSSGVFIPEVDGIRFVAISAVVIYHIAGLVEPNTPKVESGESLLVAVLHSGRVGVPLFFVLSGFILSLPFAVRLTTQGSSPLPIKAYFLRRIARLEPPYIVCLAVFFLLNGARGKYLLSDAVPNLLASIGYVHNLVYGENSIINGVAWSLEVEIQFYILAPLLAQVFRLSLRLRTVLVTLAIIALVTFQSMWPTLIEVKSLAGFGQYFLAGFLLTELYLHRRAGRRTMYCDALFWISMILVVSGQVLIPQIKNADASILVEAAVRVLTPFLMVAGMWSVFRGVATGWLLTRPVVVVLGGACYSIYLTHYAVVVGIGALLPLQVFQLFWMKCAVATLLIMPPIVMVGMGFYLVIERPCMDPAWPAKLRGVLDRWLSRSRLTPD